MTRPGHSAFGLNTFQKRIQQHAAVFLPVQHDRELALQIEKRRFQSLQSARGQRIGHRNGGQKRDAQTGHHALFDRLDLVELQLRVAAGERLPDLSKVVARGHAIEARVSAEDPAKGFIPKPGPIDELVWAGGRGEVQTDALRIESGVLPGSKVTPFYDPMVAKVVAWGATREAAIATLDEALGGTTIAPCVTNLGFLRRILASAEFRASDYDTKFAELLAKRP